MNLAIKDVSYSRFKFFSSTVGVSLLIMVVVTIGGIVRGVILDSSTIVEETQADLWVVQAYGAHPQQGTVGPFVEISGFPNRFTMRSRQCPAWIRRVRWRRPGNMLKQFRARPL